MTDEERYSSGELLRLIQALGVELRDMRAEGKDDRHELNNKLNAMFVQNEGVRTRLTAAEQDITHLGTDLRDTNDRVDAVVKNAAFASGGISLGAWLLSVFWRSH